MLITLAQLKHMCKGKTKTSQVSNMKSFVDVINTYGSDFGMNNAVYLSNVIGQVMVESGEFNYDREIWGPTPQQKKYEGRKDLGNTQKGDGSLFRGYGPIQLTGRHNVTQYYKWAKTFAKSHNLAPPPDFTKKPSAIVTDPWEGLSVLWYWNVGNPSKKSLSKYAKDNNILMITKLINGGTTHLDQRIEYQSRAALVLLGYGTSKSEIKRFQLDHKDIAGDADGVIGDRTRMALHLAMEGKIPFVEKVIEEVEVETQVPIPVPVKVESLDKPWYKDIDGLNQIAGGGLMTMIVSFLTNADTLKIIAIAGVAAASIGVWYLIRRSKAKAQDLEVKRIESYNE